MQRMEVKRFFLFDTEGNTKNFCGYDADYIICEIQSDVDIEVLK